MKKKFISMLGVMAIAGASFMSSCVTNEGEDTNSSGGSSNNSSSVDDRNYYSEYYENAIFPRAAGGQLYMSETPDPSIVRGDDGYFYIFTTGNGGGKCFRSTDCVNWEVHLDTVIPRPTWGDTPTTPSDKIPSVWAPDAIKIKDKWIYYYSLSGWGNAIGVGYAVADEIAGPWEDKGKLFTCAEIDLANAIDPCVFVEDEHVYMAVGSFQGIDLIELSSDGMSLLNGASYQREHKTLIAGTYGQWNAGGFEGSYIIKKDGYYYYFGSHGTCCAGTDSSYNVAVARSTSITGPYMDAQGRPIAYNNNNYGTTVVRADHEGGDPFAGPGHCSIFQDDRGDYWMVYHAYVERDNYATRHLMMDRLLWDDNGFPYVEGKKPSYGVELEGPALLDE